MGFLGLFGKKKIEVIAAIDGVTQASAAQADSTAATQQPESKSQSTQQQANRTNLIFLMSQM